MKQEKSSRSKVVNSLALLISFTSLFLETETAIAGNLYNGWNYAADRVGDSLDVNNTGVYDIGGSAIKVDNSYVWVGITGNLPISGLNTGSTVGGFPVPNQNIGYGDYFFDFGNSNFINASNSSSLFAIRFAANNDSAATALGIYSNVKAKSVVTTNAGYWNPGSNRDAVVSKTVVDPTTGEFAWNDSYYSYPSNDFKFHNVIASGNYLGNITIVDALQLANAGFDNSAFGFSGSNSLGFRFDRNLLPDGAYTATLILECLNDMTGLRGNKSPVIVDPPTTKSVPVPGFIGGLILASSVLGLRSAKKKAVKTST